MIGLIKLYNYFFEEESFIPRRDREGQTRRSLNGKAHTTIIGEDNKYNTFELEFEGVTTKQLLLFLDIESVLYDDNEQFIEFIDPNGNQYEVIIPAPLEDSFEVDGDIDNYSITLTLEERG